MDSGGIPESVSEQKNGQRPTRYRWVILLLLFPLYLMDHADRANIGVCLPFISKEFGLNHAQAGALASMFFLGFAITQVPAGLIMYKVGGRLVTALSTVLFSVFTFLIGTAPGAGLMRLYRFGLGFFEGPAYIGGAGLLKTWFPHKEQATAMGIFMCAAALPGIWVPPVGIAIIAHWGWRWVFYLFAIPGLITATLWYIFACNTPEESRYCNAKELQYIRQSSPVMQLKKNPEVKSMGWFDAFIRVRRGVVPLSSPIQVFASWYIWGDCLIFFLINFSMYGMMAWLPTYLLKERGMSLMNMGLFAAISGFGNFLGFLGGGWASDRIWGGRRKPMMFFAAIALAVTMYCLANVPNSQAILGVLLFFSGMLGSSAMSVYTSYPMGLTTSKAYPTAVGVVVTGGALGGFFSPVLAGMLLDHFKYFSIVFGFFGLTALMTFVVALTLVEPLETASSEPVSSAAGLVQ
ncbi:MAG: MFS transporter [Syntrophorhabdales bacterium]|jgi:sugar phosphate permease